jgi:alpha-D-ribose 1-methylphosphonate 5-triphosphate synthase subunit PhnH
MAVAVAAAALAPGFADPVFDAQRVFRNVMDALARPGTIVSLDTQLDPPAPLTPELAAIALTLADHDAPVWLCPALARHPAVAAYLRFHTGAPIVADPARAEFALVVEPADCPDLASFAQGSPEYPDRSTTLVLAVSQPVERARSLARRSRDRRSRPAPCRAAAGDLRRADERRMPDFSARSRPDLAASGRVAGLPRSTRLMES